jgi:type I restriction-modification system DNA methylase subunit
MNNASDKSLESWIWDAACSIRGAQEAPKFKDFILPLIFTKRLCDVFDDELNRIAVEVGSGSPPADSKKDAQQRRSRGQPKRTQQEIDADVRLFEDYQAAKRVSGCTKENFIREKYRPEEFDDMMTRLETGRKDCEDRQRDRR